MQLLLMGVCSQAPNLCMITELMTGSLWDLLHRRKEVRLDWKLIMRFITDTAKGMVRIFPCSFSPFLLVMVRSQVSSPRITCTSFGHRCSTET